MHDQWNGFKEEKEGLRAGSKRHVFSMRKRSVLQSSDETDVFMVSSGGHLSPKPDYRIEGCFWRRNCKIRGSSGEVLAKISRKKANSSTILSDDVFSLTVEQGADCELIMAFMVVLDRICQKPFSPILCSSNAVHWSVDVSINIECIFNWANNKDSFVNISLLCGQYPVL